MRSTSKKSWIQLYKNDKEKGWEIFLEQSNQLILAVVRKHVQDYDESMEVYTYVLEQLKKQDCQKLTSYFQKMRTYNFEAWVVVVTRNCMFDWFRREKGRKRLSKSIESLPEIDQLIFEYIYRQHYPLGEAYEILKSKHGFNISFEEMHSRAEEINNILQQKTRWRLLIEWQSVLPPLPIESIENSNLGKCAKKPDTLDNPSPEHHLIESGISKIINEIFQKLSVEDRLIVELHLHRGLTLKEIADIIKEKRAWKVRRRFYKALQSMKDLLRQRGIEAADFDIF